MSGRKNPKIQHKFEISNNFQSIVRSFPFKIEREIYDGNEKKYSYLVLFLQLLPDSVDPMELLSYLDPPDLNTPPSSGGSSDHPTGDDILALFE